MFPNDSAECEEHADDDEIENNDNDNEIENDDNNDDDDNKITSSSVSSAGLALKKSRCFISSLVRLGFPDHRHHHHHHHHENE